MEKISFQIENEQKPVDFFVLEQTRIAGINYLLVTEEEEGDSEAFILKDLSNDEDNDSITSDVKSEFLNKESIDHTKVKSFSDKVLLKLAFVFDIKKLLP